MWWTKKKIQEEASPKPAPPAPARIGVHTRANEVVIAYGTSIQYPESGVLIVCTENGTSARAIFNKGEWIYAELLPEPLPKPTEAKAVTESGQPQGPGL